MNLKYFKSLCSTSLIIFLVSCGNNEVEPITYEISPTVDPNISLDCTGAWANSPLCKERNEALIELKKLDPLYQSFKDLDTPESKLLQNEVEILKKEGDKFYYDEFYFKSRDSYKQATQLITDFNDKNKNKVLDLIQRSNLAFNIGNLEESNRLVLSGLDLDPTNRDLNNLKSRILNYETVSILVNQSKELSLSNSYDEALNKIDEALSIDPDRVDAVETKNKLIADSRDYFFNQNVKFSYNSMNNDDFDAAVDFYEKAKNLFSNRPELKALKIELDKEKRIFDINRFTLLGDNSYASEDWNGAIQNYKKVIELDSNNQNINSKYSRTILIKEVYDDLNKYLANQDRLSSTNIRNNFKQAIQKSKNIQLDQEKNLISLITKAEEAFNRYNEMIIVNLVSNNQTYIDIQKTAQYNPFNEQNIKLYPGRYVLIAKKRGMQSFRKEFILEPGTDFISITAICTSSCNIFETGNKNKDDIDIGDKDIQIATQIRTNEQRKSEANNSNFIKNVKIVNSTFTNNIQCTKKTRNRAMRLEFILNLDESSKVIASRVNSVKDPVTREEYNNLRSDERSVIVVIEKALKKSRFRVPRIDGEIQVGKINHVVKVPSDFCVT